MPWEIGRYTISVSDYGMFNIYHEDAPDEAVDTKKTFDEAEERVKALQRTEVKQARREISIRVLREDGHSRMVKGLNANTGRPRLEDGLNDHELRYQTYYFETVKSTNLMRKAIDIRTELKRTMKELEDYQLPKEVYSGRMNGDEVLEAEDRLIGRWEEVKRREDAGTLVE